MTGLRISYLAVAAGAALVSSAALAFSAPQYRIVALEPLPGGESIAFGLNDRGQIVGDSRKDRSGNVGQSRPVVWDYSGQPTELWSEQNIGGNLWDINNAGEIVGRYGSGLGIPLPGSGVQYGRAFYWSESTGRIDIGFEPTGNSQAVAINERGQVVGTSERLELIEIDGVLQPQYIPHPFIWDLTNGIRDLGTLGGYGGLATAINNLGQVVGYADLPVGHERAFIWDEVEGMRELDTQTGADTRANAINVHGQVIGFQSGVGAFIWNAANGTQFIPVGGYAINNLGQVIGGAKEGLAMWNSTHGTRFLEDLLPAGTRWELGTPLGINDLNEFVGYGLIGGERRGFLMTPVPEPASLLIATGAVFLVMVSLRFRSPI